MTRQNKRRGVGWKPVVVDNFRFVSQGEADRYVALRLQYPQLNAQVSDEYALLVCTVGGRNEQTETFRLSPARNGHNKHHAKMHRYDGHLFRSGLELERYLHLRAHEAAGDIVNLRPHPEFEFIANGQRIGRFTLDFEYVIARGPARGEVVIEDTKCKSTKTEAYQLRKRMLKVFHQLVVSEVFFAKEPIAC